MGKIVYEIPAGTHRASCSGCGADIYWVKTKKGKNMPVDPSGEPHWATCPDAKRFSKKK